MAGFLGGFYGVHLSTSCGWCLLISEELCRRRRVGFAAWLRRGAICQATQRFYRFDRSLDYRGFAVADDAFAAAPMIFALIASLRRQSFELA